MKQLALPSVAVATLLYVVLNHAWLTVANSPSVSEGSRPLLKSLCVALAIVVYVAMAVFFAVREESSWVRRTALNSGAAVAIALILIIASSVVWRRGQFFHDVEPLARLPSLAAMVLGAAVLAAALSPLLGLLARVVLRRAPN